MNKINISLENIPHFNKDINLVLGYFDGLHLGHKLLIKKAKEEGYKLAVLTFDNSPKNIINKDRGVIISNDCQKEELFSDLGVDILLVLHFDIKLSLLDKNEFINKVIKIINPHKIFVGEDYSFGHLALGKPDDLKFSFNVEVIPLLTINNEKISTTNIMKFLNSGDIKKANNFLGRNYQIIAKVIHGFANGRKIGFKTANLELVAPFLIPQIGVYMGYAEVNNKKYKAIINIGTHPTISELAKPLIEVNILDFDLDIYNQIIKVDFIDFIREEKKFTSLQELKEQLQKDTLLAKKDL